MILFCDTSALIKLYVQEQGSEHVLEVAAQASYVVVSRLAWVEALSAFARRMRENPTEQQEQELTLARQQFCKDWPDYFVIDANQAIMELAGDYTEIFALRAYDSVQLASAKMAWQTGEEALCFACYDKRLSKAAKLLGMDQIVV